MAIDDFFERTSLDAARDMIGMSIECQNGIYVVTATKAYYGSSPQTRSKSRLQPGHIMLFNIRGNLHFCISTGQGQEQNYFLIHKLLGSQAEIKSAGAVSKALGLTSEHEGRGFSGIFGLSGMTKPSILKQGDAPTCLRIYELDRSQ